MRGIGMRKLSIWLNIKNGDFLPFVLLLYIMYRSREHNAGTLKRKFTRVFWNTTSQCTYFLYFSSSHLQSTTPHQTPSPSTPYRHIPLHTYSPAPKGVVKYDTPPLFSKKNYPLSTISHISLDISSLCLYNIWTYVLFLLGTAAGYPPRKDTFASPGSVCTRQKFKGCRETRLPPPQGGISNCRWFGQPRIRILPSWASIISGIPGCHSRPLGYFPSFSVSRRSGNSP